MGGGTGSNKLSRTSSEKGRFNDQNNSLIQEIHTRNIKNVLGLKIKDRLNMTQIKQLQNVKNNGNPHESMEV